MGNFLVAAGRRHWRWLFLHSHFPVGIGQPAPRQELTELLAASHSGRKSKHSVLFFCYMASCVN